MRRQADCLAQLLYDFFKAAVTVRFECNSVTRFNFAQDYRKAAARLAFARRLP